MTKPRPRKNSALALTGAFDLFSKSYQLIKKNFEVFMVLFSVGAVVALWETLGRYVEDEQPKDAKSYIVNRLFSSNVDTGVFAAGGVMFVVSIAYVLTYLLLTIAVLRVAQGHKLTLGSLWRELTGNWLWLKILGSFVAVAVALVAGLILLIVPGVILLWRLFFVPFIIIDQKVSIEEAFRKSWRMTRNYPWAIYSIVLVTLLFAMGNVIHIFGPLVAYFLGAVYMVAPAIRYVELKNLTK